MFSFSAPVTPVKLIKSQTAPADLLTRKNCLHFKSGSDLLDNLGHFDDDDDFLYEFKNAITSKGTKTSSLILPQSITTLIDMSNVKSHSKSVEMDHLEINIKPQTQKLSVLLKNKKRPKSPNNILRRSYWRPSLQFIYGDEELLKLLTKFMKSQYNSENILFLQSVYELKQRVYADHININSKISEIYDKYILYNSPNQVNLSSDTFVNILDIYGKYKTYNNINKKKSIFNLCVDEIEKLIQNSILNGFYHSNLFQNIAKIRNIYKNVAWSKNVSMSSNIHYIMSLNGIDKGYHEWTITILKCDQNKQEIGIISNYNNINGDIHNSSSFGSRAVYGCDKMNKNVYYSSHNNDNSIRCNKSLSLNYSFCRGDVIKMCVNLKKGNIKYYTNNKKVRKTISIQKNIQYYPIILYSGNCEYEIIKSNQLIQ